MSASYLERAAEALERMTDGIGALKYRVARAMLPKGNAPPTITVVISSVTPAGEPDADAVRRALRREPGFVETRILAAIAVASALALALLSGCSAREALREIRDNARFSVYAIDHPRHGHCREVSLTSSSATAGESGAVYAGLCSHSIDSGAAADAAVGE